MATRLEPVEIEIIDETVAPPEVLAPVLPPAPPKSKPVHRASALPRSAPIATVATPRPSLPWGAGTSGWPRTGSRVVRLFIARPDALVEAAVGGHWRSLRLSDASGVLDAPTSPTTDPDDAAPWPVVVPGTLQMPYPSAPLEVTLEIQPFHRRYSRVDLVLRSPHRRPRRYFDVASRCLTAMQHTEERP